MHLKLLNFYKWNTDDKLKFGWQMQCGSIMTMMVVFVSNTERATKFVGLLASKHQVVQLRKDHIMKSVEGFFVFWFFWKAGE